jgi:hypothetical protein
MLQNGLPADRTVREAIARKITTRMERRDAMAACHGMALGIVRQQPSVLRGPDGR